MIRTHRHNMRLVLGLAIGCVMATTMLGQVDTSARGSAAVYLNFAKYPPESSRLNPSNWDLLHPYLTESSPMPLISSQFTRQLKSLESTGMSEEELEQSVTLPSGLPTYQFETNRTILTGTQDELVARLTVTPPEGSAAAPVIHVTKAELIGDSYFGSPFLGTVPYSCDATSPVCTFHWTAPAADKKYWGALELDVTLTMEGANDEFMARQSFYSSPIVAGSFNGSFEERLENGSLVIDASVNVQTHMACFLSANLYSVDKSTPVQHVERRMLVDPSVKTISFTFFGKVFRDYGDEGIFRLQDLKGQCENLAYPPEWFINEQAHRAEWTAFQKNPPATIEPTQIYFESNTYSYTTASYPLSAFSDAEWQSAAKTRKLAMYNNAAAKLADPAVAARKQQLLQQLQSITSK